MAVVIRCPFPQRGSSETSIQTLGLCVGRSRCYGAAFAVGKGNREAAPEADPQYGPERSLEVGTETSDRDGSARHSCCVALSALAVVSGAESLAVSRYTAAK